MISISSSSVLLVIFIISTITSIVLTINMGMRLKRTKDAIDELIKEWDNENN